MNFQVRDLLTLKSFPGHFIDIYILFGGGGLEGIGPHALKCAVFEIATVGTDYSSRTKSRLMQIDST